MLLKQKAKDSGGKLSRTDLFSLAFGQIIGVGIMTMTGIAIGMTGRSVTIAFLLAGAITLFTSIPSILIGGTAKFPGGQYTQYGILSGARLAGVYTYINLFTIFGLAMYALSFSQYFLSLFPSASIKIVSVVVLTVLFLLHLIGVKQASRLQNLMCIILSLSIAAYIVFGIGAIQPGYFKGPEFMTGGVSGFILATIYLTFASSGGVLVVNYSGVAKNPTKDIPFVIIISTACIVIIYAVMGTIASGVLPVAQAAHQPMSVSAAVFMPKSIFTFFVVGGAMFALLTTINFSIGMMLFPAQRACEDGWLPRSLAATNKRFGTSHWILLIFYLIGVIPIVMSVDITVVANSTVILITLLRCFTAFCSMQLPKRMPKAWKRSKFHLKKPALYCIGIVSMIITAISVIMLLASAALSEIIGNLAVLILAVIVVFIRHRHIKLNTEYELMDEDEPSIRNAQKEVTA